MKPPAFQFYADRFMSGTSDMSNAEVGAYIRLLCQQWTKGGLPNDPDRLSIMAGAMPVLSLGHVLAKFKLCPDGMLRNPVMEQIRQEQDEYRRKQSEKGFAGASKRWGNGTGNGTGNACAIAGAMPGQWPEHGSTTTSTTTEEERGNARARDDAQRFPSQSAEVPDLEQAKAMVMGVGIPDDFVALAHADWMDNAGCNGKGIPKPWTAYVRGRWRYEEVEWRNGTHRGKKRNGGANAAHCGPSWKEVLRYCDEKGGAPNVAVGFFHHWKRERWERFGKPIDWKVEFSSELVRQAKKDQQ